MNAASRLLVQHVPVPSAGTVVHLNFGEPTFALHAARTAARVMITDRSIVAAAHARTAVAGADAGGEPLIFHGQGLCPLPAEVRGTADLVAVRIPKDRASQHQLLHHAHALLRDGGRCVIAGATNEGVKTVARSMSELFGVTETVAHGSGHRVVSATKNAAHSPETAAGDVAYVPCNVFREVHVTLRDRALTLHTRPGVFSWDEADEGTALLAAAMEVGPGESVLDLGCGAGALGTVAALMSDGGAVCMVDADAEAVRCARRTADAAGALNVLTAASDVASAVIDRRFDVVVTNPPFHSGRDTDLDLPRRFIEDAWTVLKPGGRLYLVANRTLPYERPIAQRFGDVQALHSTSRFKILTAKHVQRP